MLSLVALALVGTCLSFTVALPAPIAATTAKVPAPTKYAACKANDCPLFRVVKKIAHDIELREYSPAWWANTQVRAPIINGYVRLLIYWPLRRYVMRNNMSSVPVTKLIETIRPMDKVLTMSFYLPNAGWPKPPRPSNSKVHLWFEYKPLQVYVKIVKGVSFRAFVSTQKVYADNLATTLNQNGYRGTFYPPNVKYMTAGYDRPRYVPTEQRTNEVWLIKIK